ncbi:MAG: glutaredoxin [Myxococcales bacterium]|nr:glutaredoxin [Myxococcales bacterium]
MWTSDRTPAAAVPAPTEARELVLFKYDACGFCRRVMAALQQLDLTVAMRDTLREPEARQELLQATGRTQVPCLFVDGQPLLESADIIDWLRAYAENVPRQDRP